MTTAVSPARVGHVVRMARGTVVTLGVAAGLGAAAIGITSAWPTGPTLTDAPPTWLAAALLLITFAAAEAFLMNIEFRRQAHTLTLAGIPLVLGALLAPITVVVLARVVGAGITLAVQRMRADKFVYNLSAYAFEAAADAAILHALLGSNARLGLDTALIVLAVVIAMDQVIGSLVLTMIGLHNGPLTRRAVADALVPCFVLTTLSTVVGVGVILLTSAGALGDVVVVAGAAAGLLLYRGYLGMSRRHAALELVHDFVTGSAGADSVAAAARQLLPRVRTLLRAGSVEMLVLPDETAEASDASATLLVDSDDGFRCEPAPALAHDWPVMRALRHGEPLLVPRSTRDGALLGWLRDRGYRDAMVVAFPAGSGITGTVTVSDRLGETATFTSDDLTLLQTLSGHLSLASTSARMVERLAHDANHDPLTGLANRAGLVRHVEDDLPGRRGLGAVLMIDLDRFNEVNDTLGYRAGDTLLRVIADRLRAALPSTARAARLGADEFAVYLCELAGLEDARVVAASLAADLARPINIDSASLTVEVSVGIALAPAPATADWPSELIRRAAIAMYTAKQNNDRLACYDADLDRGRAENLALLADLRTALSSHPEQFTLCYQPKIDLATRQVVGAEALVRWNHPELGIVAPDRFIPLAETSGLIRQLTPLVLTRALAECRRWAAHGRPLSVAVNVSARSVDDPTLPRQIATALADAGLPAERLVVEITESSILGDPDHALGVLGEIADLGVAVSLDDFGTGYSSLSYLHRFPACEVKIDKSFVQGLAGIDGDAVASRALVGAVIDLGRNLGLRVVAEGAETPEVLDLLEALGCHTAQGYTIARPLGEEAFLDWLVTRQEAGARPVRLVPAG